MPLRKKIFFSFLAMIMIGFAQMISSVSGLRQQDTFNENLSQANALAIRVTELTALVSRVQRLELECLTRDTVGKGHEQTLAEYDKALASLAKIAEQLGHSQVGNEAVLKPLDKLNATLKNYKSALTQAQAGLTTLAQNRDLVSSSLAQLRSADEKPETVALLADVQSQWFQVLALLSADKFRTAEGARLIQSLRQSLATLQQKTEGRPISPGVKKLAPLVETYLVNLETLGREPDGVLGQLRQDGKQLEGLSVVLAEYAQRRLAENTEMLNQQVNNQKSWALIVGIVCMALGVLLAFFLTREIVKPIEEFRSAADKVSRGDPNVTLPEPTGEDEMAELSRAFQRMLNSLRALMSQDEDNEA